MPLDEVPLLKKLPTFTLFALGGLGACQPSSPESRVDRLVEHFLEEPGVVADEVTAMEDPILQETAVLRISEQYPGRAGKLCDLLSDHVTASYCHRLTTRPHLTTVLDQPSPEAATVVDRPAAGPPTGATPAVPSLRERWDAVQPEPGACDADAATFHPCLWALAMEHAVTGDLHAAAAACNASRSSRAIHDCYFTAAEKVGDDPRHYRDAALLCQGAGPLFDECNGHLFMHMRRERRGEQQNADQLAEGASIVAAAWRELSPELEPLMVDLYWAQHIERLLPPQRPVNRGSLERQPPAASTHVRNAMAWRLSGCTDPVAAMAEAQAAPPPDGVHCPPGRGNLQEASRRSRLRDERDEDFSLHWLHWSRDLEGEETIPASYFLIQGRGRRAADPDPGVDGLLAMLTVQAFQEEVPAELYASYLEDERLVVRWTATRLLAAVQPGHPDLALAAEDPDPRVRRRARPAD